jgi:hypothetical protein
MTILRCSALAVCMAATLASAQDWRLDLEGLSTSTIRNETAIPQGATRFRLTDALGRGPVLGGRMTLTRQLEGQGHAWRLMIAPYDVSGTGTFSQDIDFEGATFSAGVPTQVGYRFNSYRLTYMNRWRGNWNFGGTLKVRDAWTYLDQNGQRRTKKDLGVVPLFHLSGEEPLGGPWSLRVELDAAWAPQGQAFDLGVLGVYGMNDRTSLYAGFRTLEGGADNRQLYTWAQFFSVAIGASVRF